MRRKSTLIVIALFGVVALGFLLSAVIRREPTYQGRTVSAWFKEFCISRWRLTTRTDISFEPAGPVLINYDTGERVDDPALFALRAMGSESVPYLIRTLKRKETVLGKTYRIFYLKLSPGFRQFLPSAGIPRDKYRQYAAEALAGVGTNALPAVPALIQCLGEPDPDPSLMYSALAALRPLSCKPQDLDPVLRRLSNRGQHWRVVMIVERLQLRGSVAVTALGKTLQDTNSAFRDSFFQRKAATYLERLGPAAAPAVAELAAALKNPDSEVRYLAARALGEIGTNAIPAIPALQAAAQVGDDVRYAPERALKKIALAISNSASAPPESKETNRPSPKLRQECNDYSSPTPR